MREDFSGRVALVTGAGVGIGYGICKALAAAGATVALNDVDRSLAKAAAAKINAGVEAERVYPVAGDVADVGLVRGMVDGVVGRDGRLDIVVANAGITNFGRFLEYTPEAFDRVVGVNLRGSYFTAQAAARAMVEGAWGDGRILLMSSVTGVQAYPNLSVYGMTKAALRHLAKMLAVELAGTSLTVNAIAPGATLTERTLADDPDYAENWAGVVPTARIGEVADVVAATLFLASPAARHITGHTLIVDGGWTVTSPIPEETPELPAVSSRLG